MKRKKVKYESRSRHAKSRKRGKDGKFLPTADENCSRISSDTTLNNNSNSDQKNEQDLMETESIGRDISPHNLQRPQVITNHEPLLSRNGSTISVDLFKNCDKTDYGEPLFEGNKMLGTVRNW